MLECFDAIRNYTLVDQRANCIVEEQVDTIVGIGINGCQGTMVTLFSAVQDFLDFLVLVGDDEIFYVVDEVRFADNTYFVDKRTSLEHINGVFNDFFTCDFHELLGDVVSNSHSGAASTC